MVPIRVEGPAVEPVTLSEMRAYLRLGEDERAEDELIAALIATARQAIEAAGGRVLIESRWRVRVPDPPPRTLVTLLSPLTAVDAAVLRDAAGIATPLPADRYRLDESLDPPRIGVDLGTSVPAVGAALEIEFRAGYGAAPEAVPGPLRQGVRTLVAHWFENRGDVLSGAALPPEVLGLIAPYRRARL